MGASALSRLAPVRIPNSSLMGGWKDLMSEISLPSPTACVEKGLRLPEGRTLWFPKRKEQEMETQEVAHGDRHVNPFPKDF